MQGSRVSSRQQHLRDWSGLLSISSCPWSLPSQQRVNVFISIMAANQARRRTDIDSTPTIDSGSQLPKAFIYQQLDLDPDEDSIRLVLIESSTNIDNQLSCSLIHVKFAEKRRYKALSTCGELRLLNKRFSSTAQSSTLGRIFGMLFITSGAWEIRCLSGLMPSALISLMFRNAISSWRWWNGYTSERIRL